MDAACFDADLSRVRAQDWIPRNAPAFRHLPPPGPSVWLAPSAGDCHPPLGDGWLLRELGGAATDLVDARWFNLSNPGERIQLLSSIPQIGNDEAAPFAWAHRALARQALRLRIRRGDGPSHLHLSRPIASGAAAPLLVIELMEGAECVLLESTQAGGSEPGAENLQVHVRLSRDAVLRHLRVVLPENGDRVAHHLHIRAGERSSYRQALLAGGGAYHLQRSVVDLEGKGAAAHFGAVLLAAGSALEQQFLARHATAGTDSHLHMLALASGAARMVANASTQIAAGSGNARARQHLCGVPVAGQPRIVLRPHMEIHHDDVEAAHGATWGTLPEDALFHARQRGLDEVAAKALILEGMARAVLDGAVDDSQLPKELALEDALSRAVSRLLSAPREAVHG